MRAKAKAEGHFGLFLDVIQRNRPATIISANLAEYFAQYALLVLKIPMIHVQLQALSFDPNRTPLGPPTHPDNTRREIVYSILENMYNDWDPYERAVKSFGLPPFLLLYPKNAFLKEERRRTSDLTLPLYSTHVSLHFSKILYLNIHPNLILVGTSIIDAAQQELWRR